MKSFCLVVQAVILGSLLACAAEPDPLSSGGENTTDPASGSIATNTEAPPAGLPRNAYFGDLHVHTAYSLDAFIFAVKATPDDAYRYAKGEALKHPAGMTLQLRRPLDFYAVTDHGFFLGALVDGSKEEAFRDIDSPAAARRAFSLATQHVDQGRASPLYDEAQMADAWRRIVDAAERHNDPGRFTAFIGYEYTSAPEYQNLHRNVIFKGNQVPPLPFSRFDSDNPQDLWSWMDGLRDRGIESLAIPHNANGSNGQMFRLTDWAGNPIDNNYAESRMRNEPLVEITQVKGTSDTHPLLSPNDEWADFEIFPYRIASRLPSEPRGSYVREALINGLQFEHNPFRFGLVGASDTHNGATADDERDYVGKAGLLDGTAEQRGSVPLALPVGEGAASAYTKNYFQYWSASGLTGLWAEDNTREALYNAMRRKETFATTGPRIRVRFFAGFDYTDEFWNNADPVIQAYRSGVPMGGDLLGRDGAAPRFVVWALQDPLSAPLQRLQVIKGWVQEGRGHERVYDVACSGNAQVEAQTHRCPDNGARVNLEDCSYSRDKGAAELRTLWRDPDFDPSQRAFYYVRALENPTCRWSTWDAVRAGVAPRPDLANTLQERAWSSPIWYSPE